MSIKITKVGSIHVLEDVIQIPIFPKHKDGWAFEATENETDETIARALYFAYMEKLMSHFDKFKILTV